MEQQQSLALLMPLRIGGLLLANRVAMAPMTRGRVKNELIAPTAAQATYYRQRATAGLILTEGTWISKQAIGFVNVPGIFTPEQIKGWLLVTEAVHREGGKIFLQLGHAGAASHPDFYHGALPVGPSAVNPNLTAYTPAGPQPTVTPRALSKEDIKQIVQDYRVAAENAQAAGFDGVELHAQHPSLLSQFLSDTLNQRQDEYGGSVENKARLLLEVVEVVASVWGSQRVSVRINPFLSYSGRVDAPEDTLPTYAYVAEKLSTYNLAFLHVVDRREPGVTDEQYAKRRVFETFRTLYQGVLMANGGLTPESAEELVRNGQADLVSFGSAYIANPDLVQRLAHNLPLTVGDSETYFTGDDNGYTDYAAVTHTPALI